ncbi:shikimate dehydrogenase [Cryobacterium sp. TMT1-21]|uniref:Shikimate dehydrogenase n=1 Tax=Cryobacterium shii TaxID=1259235 RepID=A0AAQ2HGJ3_9MICO|nr:MULTISPECIES: shikimate dehydrogenase [Cryobacterium]TFC51668.1 shikimate dehydrogenase [Cryobacterium shii]TFC83662.1 shikimate dehydrogenase [Cryobacterium sp. TmT2-59]TFD13635.1 shikimate dehydrogenase [Cryobacterium sp. TMT4-10]TFD16002.1 shikimate dehydrogenase [Cryobacterium sp. TMT1-21]TFD27093.1 shikimate dehydrogenase [Cryobacterium sp. TMT2-23]
MARHAASVAPRRLAVLGSPIAHSLSPALHRAAYRALMLDWRYNTVEVTADGLASFVGSLDADWLGLSLTMPLKHEILPLLDGVDRVAAQTGSVNTVLFGQADGRRTLQGFNTDVPGLVRALAEAGVRRADHVTVLGAGATGASALVAAADLGAESVDVLVRTPAKAADLIELGRSLGVVVTVGELADLADPSRHSELVISTLPGGTALGGEFPADLRRRAPLFDVSYSPWPSELARSWAFAGGSVSSGQGMLLHQALIQVRIFRSGDPFEPLPGEDAVLQAMRGALTGQAVTG